MGQCVLCKQFFPPGFTEETEDGKAKKCIFCEREKDEIEYIVDDKVYHLKKNDIINEYKKYIKQVAEKPNVKKIISEEGNNV